MNEEKICSCALNRIFGYSPKTGLALISCIGSAKEIFQMDNGEIDRLLGPYSKFRGKINGKAAEDASKELDDLEKKGIKFIGWTEEDYPELLHECEDAPIGMYVRSLTPMNELWKPRLRIGVVGTRDISPYGREWCIRTVNGLAATEERPVIVSGLAIGTDFYAHRTALECGLPTIGVMPTGPETVYPLRHHDFAEKLCSTPGCALVTDYPPGTAPLQAHFLRRNRIIAGLSESTILIESKLKGGGLMTCNLAFSYGREVYALPGRADDLRSQGCNSLIRKKVAEPLTSVEDLMDSMNLKRRAQISDKSPQKQAGPTGQILALIGKERGITVEDLSAATGIPFGQTSGIVRRLETEGFVTVDLFQRCCLLPIP